MLNYFERIDDYKRKLYFQVNGKYLDIYKPKVHLWSQDLEVTKDILTYASESGIADAYGVLVMRTFAGNLNANELRTLNSMLDIANGQLAEKLGENDITKSMNLPKRHFSAIVWEDVRLQKPKEKEVFVEEFKQEEISVEEVNDDTEPKRRKYSKSHSSE